MLLGLRVRVDHAILYMSVNRTQCSLREILTLWYIQVARSILQTLDSCYVWICSLQLFAGSAVALPPYFGDSTISSL